MGVGYAFYFIIIIIIIIIVFFLFGIGDCYIKVDFSVYEYKQVLLHLLPPHLHHFISSSHAIQDRSVGFPAWQLYSNAG